MLSEIHTQSDEIPAKIPVLINGITTSRNRSQKISSRISEFKLGRVLESSCQTRKMGGKKNVMISEQKSECTIIILGDSHACSLAERLKSNTKGQF